MKRFFQVARRGLLGTTVLAFLLFYPQETPAVSGGALPWQDLPLLQYGIKVALALLLLWGGSLALIRWGPLPRKGAPFGEAPGGMALLSSTMLGRGRVYALSCGPDVVVLWIARKEAVLLGRWPREEWMAWDGNEKSSPSLSSE
jgi:hypothetical protein